MPHRMELFHSSSGAYIILSIFPLTVTDTMTPDVEDCIASPEIPVSPKRRNAATSDDESPTKKSKISTSNLRNPSELTTDEWTTIDRLRDEGKTWPEIGKEMGCKHGNSGLRNAHAKRRSDAFEWTTDRRAEYKSLLTTAIRDISAKMVIPKAVFEKELKLKELGLM